MNDRREGEHGEQREAEEQPGAREQHKRSRPSGRGSEPPGRELRKTPEGETQVLARAAPKDDLDPLGELIERQPPPSEVLAQGRRSLITVGVT